MAERVEKKVGLMLRERNLTIAIAESCTGGLLGHMVTQVPGSSDYFMGGVIAYHNDAKIKLLGVKGMTIKRYGAVSRQTAIEMADGACRIFRADIALSTTGIAGPGGGTVEKPVGLVYIGLATMRGKMVKKHLFSGSRHNIKKKAAYAALVTLQEYLAVMK
ncbi:MAG: nicotinamide-nucleotide amidohydrolase family protein [Candidatus Aureabacteria bacterium]|nr:nicotinamide-nucleotide amidohydrolase family protein [Candidatus Auribacterota bacterium]